MTRTTVSIEKWDKATFDKFREQFNENLRRREGIPEEFFHGLNVAEFFAIVLATAMTHKDEVFDCDYRTILEEDTR